MYVFWKKGLKRFTYELTSIKTLLIWGFYLLPKLQKRLNNVSGRSIIPNYAAPTEKASEFLDFPLKDYEKWSVVY